MQNKLLAVILVGLLTVKHSCCDEIVRELKATYNPNCTQDLSAEECANYRLVHIEAASDANTIHYVWNLDGKPSSISALTSKNASLVIDWRSMNETQKAISFTEEPKYVYASVINSMFVFNDTKDHANVSDEDSVGALIRFDTHTLNWTLITNLTKDEGRHKVYAAIQAKTINNGTFSIMFTAYGTLRHGDELPHLYHSSDSMQVDVFASKIRSNFSNPRIAMEILTMTSENRTEGASQVNRIRNLDDEFTPGIFDVYHVLSPRSNNNTQGGFLQFRPVCYNSHNRTVSSSTELRYSNPWTLADDGLFNDSLPLFYFDDASNRLQESLNITFGMPDDGFFSRTNYISFSYLIGVGSPLKEGLSLFVIIFASIGLGVPLLVLIFGGAYVAVKRYRD